jgi:hypothetical protein
MKRLVLVLAVAALMSAAPAESRLSPGPTVDIHTAAGLAPDGGSVTVTVFASCPERSELVEAIVSVSQLQASGQASFSFPCIGSVRGFSVTVPAQSGTFELGDAHAHAVVVSKRGKLERAEDDETVDVQPSVFVDLADTATVDPGGGAVSIDVTVACPVGTTPEESYVNVQQGQSAIGSGTYFPICDGQQHTFSVHVLARRGVYQTGDARALTFANTSYQGTLFAGVDDVPIRIVS